MSEPEYPLLNFVLEHLQASKGHWRKVSQGSGVPKRTIEKIAAGLIDDPGVKKLEKLAAYFRQVQPDSASASAPTAHVRAS